MARGLNAEGILGVYRAADLGGFAGAVNQAAAAGGGLVWVTDAEPVHATLTVPATVGVHVTRSGALNIDSGVTLTQLGPLDAGPYQIFTGAGTVVFGPGAIEAVKGEWFGVSPSGNAATNSAAFAAALAALPATGGALILLPGTKYNGQIAPAANRANLRILAIGATLLPGGTDTGIAATGPADLGVFGLEIDGTNQTGTAHGAYITNGTRVAFHGVHAHHTYTHGVAFDGGSDLTVDDDCTIHNCGDAQPQAGGSASGVYARNFTRLSCRAKIHDCTRQYSQGVFLDGTLYAWTQATIGGQITNCGANMGGGGGIAASSHPTNPAIRGSHLTLDGPTIVNSGDGACWLNCDDVTGHAVIDGTQFGYGLEIQEARRINLRADILASHKHGCIVHQQTASIIPTERIRLDLVEAGSVTGDGLHVVNDSTSGAQPVRHVTASGSYSGNAGWGIQGTQDADYITVMDGTEYDGNTLGTVNVVGTGAHNRVFGNAAGGATVAVTASPMTYTAGPRPETVYLVGGAGVTVQLAGFAVALAAPPHVALSPNEQIVITYTGAPTCYRDIH